ncbi:Uncharacterised protein [Chlamydia trachomatis]|nr:Uncharacterised protein [Chlamydia trachomatis]
MGSNCFAYVAVVLDQPHFSFNCRSDRKRWFFRMAHAGRHTVMVRYLQHGLFHCLNPAYHFNHLVLPEFS